MAAPTPTPTHTHTNTHPLSELYLSCQQYHWESHQPWRRRGGKLITWSHSQTNPHSLGLRPHSGSLPARCVHIKFHVSLLSFSMVSVSSRSSPHPPTQPNTIAGSSLLNVMDQFALNAGSSLLNGNPLNSADRRFLNTDNIGMVFSSS